MRIYLPGRVVNALSAGAALTPALKKEEKERSCRFLSLKRQSNISCCALLDA
jgi:hypothetical protein